MYYYFYLELWKIRMRTSAARAVTLVVLGFPNENEKRKIRCGVVARWWQVKPEENEAARRPTGLRASRKLMSSCDSCLLGVVSWIPDLK